VSDPADIMSAMAFDLFVAPDADPRVEPPPSADERTMLLAYLRRQRGTLELKCGGLDADALARRAVEPSSLSLLGLVRHLSEAERAWFRRAMAGQDAPPRFFSATDLDGAFDHAKADPALVAEAWAAWREEAAFADSVIVEARDLDVLGHHRVRGPVSLRWVVLHMIEEYARHLGHVDLLRERIDGAVGE
jgi:uncharacterized damage-inducible protein DinB